MNENWTEAWEELEAVADEWVLEPLSGPSCHGVDDFGDLVAQLLGDFLGGLVRR